MKNDVEQDCEPSTSRAESDLKCNTQQHKSTIENDREVQIEHSNIASENDDVEVDANNSESCDDGYKLLIEDCYEEVETNACHDASERLYYVEDNGESDSNDDCDNNENCDNLSTDTNCDNKDCNSKPEVGDEDIPINEPTNVR